MEQTKYLVVGSSHAALEAVTAIRMHDPDGSLTLLTRDPHLPYSPTVLPYVVSGRSAPDGIFLRDEKFFATLGVQLKRGTALKALHVERNAAELADGALRPGRHRDSARDRQSAGDVEHRIGVPWNGQA